MKCLANKKHPRPAGPGALNDERSCRGVPALDPVPRVRGQGGGGSVEAPLQAEPLDTSVGHLHWTTSFRRRLAEPSLVMCSSRPTLRPRAVARGTRVRLEPDPLSLSPIRVPVASGFAHRPSVLRARGFRVRPVRVLIVCQCAVAGDCAAVAPGVARICMP